MTLRLVAEGLCRQRGTRKVLRDVTFSLEEGRRLVVFGPNGAGKTTLLRLLALLDRPNAGTVAVLDGDAALEPVAARACIGFVTHAPFLYLDLSAEENLLLFARLYGLRDAPARVAELLESVGLTHRRNDAVRGFSRGMVQRMAIARALVNDPGILLLDEAWSGLDPRGAGQLRQLVTAGAQHRVIVEVSHDFETGWGDCTDMLLLDRGRVAELFSKADVCADEARNRYRAVLEGRSS